MDDNKRRCLWLNHAHVQRGAAPLTHINDKRLNSNSCFPHSGFLLFNQRLSSPKPGCDLFLCLHLLTLLIKLTQWSFLCYQMTARSRLVISSLIYFPCVFFFLCLYFLEGGVWNSVDTFIFLTFQTVISCFYVSYPTSRVIIIWNGEQCSRCKDVSWLVLKARTKLTEGATYLCLSWMIKLTFTCL